jgi:hypothetical protein
VERPIKHLWHLSKGHVSAFQLLLKDSIHSLYVIPIQSILGKLPLVPVDDTSTILHSMHNAFSGAPGDWRPGAGENRKSWILFFQTR